MVSCPHDEIDGITCRICGTKMVAKVAKDDTLRYFADFEDAAQYAATLEGSAITLLRDAPWSSMGLPTGTYTLDLNGKTLSGSNDLMIDGSFTICDSQGGGKLWRDGTILVLGGHAAITGGQFNRVYLASDSADLSVTGGTFARIAYSGEDTSRTPLFFPAEGYTFQKADGSYANTGDVVMEENLRYLEDVTVTTPPFTITRSPVDTDLYTTTPVGYRPDFVTEVTFHIPESDPTIEFQWYQVGDPDRIKSYGSALVWQNPFTIYTFIDGPAQYYGIFSYKGYSVRTDVLTVRELVCDHPGVDAENRCSQCRAEVAASVELNGSTGYYLSLSEALALARTDAYRGCTLTVLRSSTDTISVNSGSFTLTAAQGVTLGGKVTLAKNAAVTLSGGSITGNNAASFGSGGVCVYGTMTVSGSVRITDNVNRGSKGDNGIYTGGTASNVRLVGRTTITIDGPLTEGSQIGVSLYSNRIFTSGWSKNMSDKPFSSYFIADDSSSTVALEDGELKLSNPHTHSWTYALSTTTTGSATITATCKNCAENNNMDFHGGGVTIAAPEAVALIYDGSPKAAAVTVSDDWLGASADNIHITYKQGETALSDAPTDAGTYTAGITVGEGGGAVTASVEYTIAPKELTDPTIEIASGSVYDGNAKTPNVTVKDGENTIDPSEYAVSYDNNVNAGENTATVTITDNANGNYTVSGSAKFSIAKAVSTCTAPTPITALTYTGEAQTLINAGTTVDGTMQYSTDSTNYGTTIPIGENAGEYTVWYKVAGDGNHSDTTPVSVTIAKAKVEIPAADPTQFTYSGDEQTYTLAASDLYTVAGNVRKSAGTYTVTVTLKDAENYVWSDNTATAKTFDFVIAKAPVTVTVKDKSAYTYDAAPDLSKPEPDKDYTVSGLIGEDKLTTAPTLAYDPAAPDLTKTGEAAKITASGASAGENYEITYVDGKLTVTSRPSSGGGGSSSSGGGGGSSSSGKPSASTGKTETTTNPDGSVTKTETKSDGTVTETTTNKDGSTTKTETKPDGSKTEVKDASGSTGTVKTDKNGQATAETTLSSKAVEDAKKNGEAVKTPVEVEASRDSNPAPTVKVELPKNAGETAVEIPVSNVKPGTVAVLVHPDGTEEIVKNSLPTEDGIRLTMDGSATVKIMDNSKDFIDTRAHWAKDAIDFVSARGLVNGISDTIYAPNNSTTRAQLWTILARQNDADLTGGSIWYEKAQNWAKDKGVSDGANPNAAINRAQMVTMLWRAMGQPAAASGASFADVPADSYYAQAVAWAIENGITAGVGNGKFDPDAACTRGQIATFLYRYMK